MIRHLLVGIYSILFVSGVIAIIVGVGYMVITFPLEFEAISLLGIAIYSSWHIGVAIYETMHRRK